MSRTAQTTKCINLERRFPTYQVGYEDAQFEATRDPWHKTIKCKYGHICPAGGNKLWACTSSRRNQAARAFLKGELPVRVVQDGDDGLNVEFDVSDHKIIFDVMGAKRA